jgi:hypothetical protein
MWINLDKCWWKKQLQNATPLSLANDPTQDIVELGHGVSFADLGRFGLTGTDTNPCWGYSICRTSSVHVKDVKHHPKKGIGMDCGVKVTTQTRPNPNRFPIDRSWGWFDVLSRTKRTSLDKQRGTRDGSNTTAIGQDLESPIHWMFKFYWVCLNIGYPQSTGLSPF